MKQHRGALSRRHFLFALPLTATLTATRTAAIPAVAQEASPTPTLDDDLNVSTSGWQTDFSKHSVNLSEIRSGGPPRDGIPPIDDPKYVAIADADGWLEAAEPVVAVVRNDQARAYPLQIMVWHEIVNDVLGGEPTLVTFCPLCNTAIAFDRRLEPGGAIYDFGTTGNLRFSDLVMWDRQTESWWQQLTGEAIVGELTGQRLPFHAAQLLGWSAFKTAYPTGDVLSRETGFSRPYGENPYVGYDDVNSSPFLMDQPTDGRYPPMERTVGVELGGEAVAYPYSALEASRVANDHVAGQPVVVFLAPGARSALDQSAIAESRDVGQVGVFDRRLDGQILTFAATGDAFADQETQTTWDITGRALAGPLADRQLTPLPHVVSFWFAWAAGYPETRVWAAE
ncbi:MAG: DUF3179 domain-containing protein [Thermomicrobiales bacterium]